MTIPAGPALDHLVAEKVMGWRSEAGVWSCHRPYHVPHQLLAVGVDDWQPSANIAHAWEVVEKLMSFSRTACFQVDYVEGRGFWEASFGSNDCQENEWKADADTAPHAICLAALKAVSA